MELHDHEGEGTAAQAGRPLRDPASIAPTDFTPTALSRLSPAALAARQETYRGFGDTLAVAFELAVTPVIFGLLGYGLDRWLGIVPVFTTVLVVFCIVGLSIRMWFDYDTRMKVHEADAPWARRSTDASSKGAV